MIVVLPFVALGLLGRLLWGSLIHPADIVLAAVLYTITGLGVTVGFHRGLTTAATGPSVPCASRSRWPGR
ncbi:hypothetical protein [Streptomyces sp. NBC_00299]|uniref:hypothetical protein n=1 Tax=Streptomyces sp. NBC_00299 TaxID=2975705 RepID=UPI0032506E6A